MTTRAYTGWGLLFAVVIVAVIDILLWKFGLTTISVWMARTTTIWPYGVVSLTSFGMGFLAGHFLAPIWRRKKWDGN